MQINVISYNFNNFENNSTIVKVMIKNKSGLPVTTRTLLILLCPCPRREGHYKMIAGVCPFVCLSVCLSRAST